MTISVFMVFIYQTTYQLDKTLGWSKLKEIEVNEKVFQRWNYLSKGRKHCGGKGEDAITSIFSFLHNSFKSLLYQEHFRGEHV